jgi:hypothetical protein
VQEKVRTGAIQVRKVRGDVNPADLFTKHLPTKDKIHQLVKLFGCEYRSGRSTAAPLLRPQEASGGKGGQPSASHLPAFHINDDGSEDRQVPHDIRILPHMYDQSEWDSLFPVIDAPPRLANDEDWSPGVEKRAGRLVAG